MLDTRWLGLAALTEALPPPERRTAESMRTAMAAQHTLSKAFLNVALFSKSGEMVYSAQPSVGGPFVASTRPYFIEAMLNKRDMVSQPFISTFSGTPVIVLSRPVFDRAGEVEYVLAASIPLDGKPLAYDADDDERLYYVMSSEGYLVSYPQHARITHHVNEVPDLSPGAALGLQGFQGWRHIGAVERVYAFARLKRAPWIVGLQTPEAVAFRSFNAAHDRLVLAGTALAGVALLMAWLVSFLVRERADAANTHAGEQLASENVAQAADLSSDPAAGLAPAAAATASASSIVRAPATPGPAAPAPPAALATSAHAAPAASAQPAGLQAPGRASALAAAGTPILAPVVPGGPPPLDLDAFMLQNFTTGEQRRSFISTVGASVRKLPADVIAVSANLATAPRLLHTLKGAWGSLGATTFAHVAGELEAAIKQQQPTTTLLATFEREAAQLQSRITRWLAALERPQDHPAESAGTAAAGIPAAPALPPGAAASATTSQPPPQELLPLLRERNIHASVLYESSKPYWHAQLGSHAAAFSTAMDALDFSTAERLLADATSAAAGKD